MAAVQRTYVQVKGQAANTRKICTVLAIPQGNNMFMVGLSATGTGTASHYTSTGMLDAAYADLFFDYNALWAAVQAAPNGTQGVSLTECKACVGNMQGGYYPDPFAFYTSLGLKVMATVPATAEELWECLRENDIDPMPPGFSFDDIYR